jgi:hypothetical protein
VAQSMLMENTFRALLSGVGGQVRALMPPLATATVWHPLPACPCMPVSPLPHTSSLSRSVCPALFVPLCLSRHVMRDCILTACRECLRARETARYLATSRCAAVTLVAGIVALLSSMQGCLDAAPTLAR